MLVGLSPGDKPTSRLGDGGWGGWIERMVEIILEAIVVEYLVTWSLSSVSHELVSEEISCRY